MVIHKWTTLALIALSITIVASIFFGDPMLLIYTACDGLKFLWGKITWQNSVKIFCIGFAFLAPVAVCICLRTMISLPLEDQKEVHPYITLLFMTSSIYAFGLVIGYETIEETITMPFFLFLFLCADVLFVYLFARTVLHLESSNSDNSSRDENASEEDEKKNIEQNEEAGGEQRKPWNQHKNKSRKKRHDL